MIKKNLLLFFFFAALLFSKSVFAQDVNIGSQVWMVKNLNVDKFRNGDIIPQARTDEEWVEANKNGKPAWCYYNNDPENGEKYGKLYNWYAVNDLRGLAPVGYHIPTEAEWTTILNHSESLTILRAPRNGSNIPNSGAAYNMKNTSGWDSETSFGPNPISGNGTNKSGFSGLPGGVSGNEAINQKDGRFGGLGKVGAWWSSSDGIGSSPVAFTLFYLGGASLVRGNMGEGLSVRCIKSDVGIISDQRKNELVAPGFDGSKLNSEVNQEEQREIVDVTFDVVETQPEFPGGLEGWNKYLAENIKYPEVAKKMGVQGTVIVVFVITKDGSIKDVTVLRGIGGGCDEEAIRVVKNGPKWEPGKQRGEPVNTRMRLPMKFKLG